MSTSKDEIHKQLDEIVLQFFDNLEKLSDLQTQLNDQMEIGFLSMSRSRYKMGIKSVDIGCFDTEKFTAIYKIDDTDDVLHLVQPQHEYSDKNVEVKDANTIRQRFTKPTNKSDDVSDVAEDMNKLKLEQNDDSSNNENGCVSTGDGKSQSKHRSVITKNNPLNSFGVLVPQSLRDCQNSFKKVIQLSVDIANVKSCVDGLNVEYKRLCTQLSAMD